FAMAELLAVIRHQMDRREVRLTRDPERRERAHDAIALDLTRELDDEHEPATLVAVHVGTRQLQTLDRRERLAIGRGDSLASCEHLIEPVELRHPERAGNVRQAVVEPEA